MLPNIVHGVFPFRDCSMNYACYNHNSGVGCESGRLLFLAEHGRPKEHQIHSAGPGKLSSQERCSDDVINTTQYQVISYLLKSILSL